MCSGSRRAAQHRNETASKYFLWTDSPTKVTSFFLFIFFHLVMEAAESPLVPPSFCLPFQSRQTEGSRSNCILQDADLHFLLHFDETAAELSASISSPSDFTPRSDNSGCVCVCVSVRACLHMGCPSARVYVCEFSCNVRLGMCMFKLLQSDECETSEQRECLFLGKPDMVEKKKK